MTLPETLAEIRTASAPVVRRRWPAALLLVLLLALIAKPVWEGRRQDHWGEGNDDGIYWVTAKSLATGRGYRVLNLPGEPYQTKYPPVYPLYLSLAWRMRPDFPANLTTAWALHAALLPIYLALLMRLLRQLGFSLRRTALVCALSIATFQFVLLSNSLFSELPACCFLFAAVALLEDDAATNTQAALAGLCAAGAYLTRTAALPLFAAVPVFLFLRKRPRQIVSFFAPAVPLAACWHAWGLLHARQAALPGYFAEYLRVIHATGFWANFVKQINAVSTASAENLFPGLTALLAGIPLHHLVLAAALAGSIRLARRRRWPLALIFSAFYLAMILCWWGEGVFRMLAPIWPFLVAGISQEASHILDLRKPGAQPSGASPRGRALRLAVVCLAAVVALRNSASVSSRISQVISQARAQRIADLDAYRWIAAHAAPADVVAAWKDSVSYLYTGVPASHPVFVYLMPLDPGTKALGESPARLPARFTTGLLVIMESDLDAAFAADLRAFGRIADAIPGARLQYQSPTALIYRLPLR